MNPIKPLVTPPNITYSNSTDIKTIKRKDIKMKQHKWAKEIKAWADGAEIETKYGEHDWEVEYYPNWHSDQVKYRIKKEPVIEVKYFQILKTSMHERLNINYIEFQPDLEKWDLKITYQDGVAIKAEVAE